MTDERLHGVDLFDVDEALSGLSRPSIKLGGKIHEGVWLGLTDTLRFSKRIEGLKESDPEEMVETFDAIMQELFERMQFPASELKDVPVDTRWRIALHFLERSVARLEGMAHKMMTDAPNLMKSAQNGISGKPPTSSESAEATTDAA